MMSSTTAQMQNLQPHVKSSDAKPRNQHWVISCRIGIAVRMPSPRLPPLRQRSIRSAARLREPICQQSPRSTVEVGKALCLILTRP